MSRPKLPAKLKAIRGTLRPHRETLPMPCLPAAVPLPPAHLSGTAASCWNALIKLMAPSGVLTLADFAGLEMMCECYSDLWAARNRLRELGGPVYETRNAAGGVMYRARPEVAIVSDCDRRLCAWFGRFGLTPADRSKVVARVEPKKTDPWEAFSKGENRDDFAG